MKKNLTKFFNLIKKDNQTKFLTIFTLIMLFIFTLGYSLSMFNGSSVKEVANIKVNGLSFNMTTNSGTSDDRVLHLQAGNTEQFDIILTNLNKVNVKYELIYQLCNDSNCTSTSTNIPSDLLVYKENEDTNVSDSLELDKSNSIRIITINNNSNDYYIKLNINAGYEWNDLALTNQINESFISTTKIVAYIDGKKVESMPSTCVYKADLKGYKGNKEVELENASAVCDFNTNKWTIKYTEPIDSKNNSLVDKIAIYFTPGIEPGTFADDSWTKIAEVIKYGHPEAYAVGSEKEVLIGDLYYTVRVANNTTPDECNQKGFSQTACGFVVEFVDIVEKRGMNSNHINVGGWPATAMRTYANGEFFNKLPIDLQNVIIDTFVISGHGSTSGEINFSSNDKIYLLSVREVWDRNFEDKSYDYTRQLDYYSSKGVTASNYNYVVKYYDNSNAYWWLRSVRSTHTTTFHVSRYDGASVTSNAESLHGFAPAFRIG